MYAEYEIQKTLSTDKHLCLRQTAWRREGRPKRQFMGLHQTGSRLGLIVLTKAVCQNRLPKPSSEIVFRNRLPKSSSEIDFRNRLPKSS